MKNDEKKNGEDIIPSEQYHEFVLNYGKTDEENLPDMLSDNYFCIGYNPIYGLVDVLKGNGIPVFEGRIDIGDLLAKIETDDRKEIDSQVENYIMEAYDNSMADINNSEKYDSSKPSLEVLTYEG